MAGALGVIAFHVGSPFSGAGWIAVELFFVLAGINMARAIEHHHSLLGYLRSRVRRLGPEVLAVWLATLLIVAAGLGTAGMGWFLISGPAFLQNWTLPLFQYDFPRDYVHVSLWFVGALFQLQILAFALKGHIKSAPPGVVAAASIGIGVGFRLLYGVGVGGNPGQLTDAEANLLYCLPFTHIEAITLGILLGRGALPWLGRWFPLLFLATLGLGGALAGSFGDTSAVRSFWYEFPLRLNYLHVLGYAALAWTAASLCAPRGLLASALEALELPRQFNGFLEKASVLTYAAYAFHGVFIATGLNFASILKQPHAPWLRLLLFAVTAFQAFVAAWAFRRLRRWASRRLKQGWRTHAPAFSSGEAKDRLATQESGASQEHFPESTQRNRE